MTVVTLILVSLLGLPADQDPSALVDRLGSARYTEREQASKALEALGRDALSALREARDSEDPEVRSRATILIERIENELMIRPTLVALDFRQQPISEVVSMIAKRSGMDVSLVADAMSTRRISLEATEPVPFWKAIDRLCATAQLRSNVTMQMGPDGRGAVVQLFASGTPTDQDMIYDSGPFRVTLWEIHHNRTMHFGSRGAVGQVFHIGGAGGAAIQPQAEADRHDPRLDEQFYLVLQVVAEPRMSLSQTGPLTLTEAIDERGNSLLMPDEPGGISRNAGYFGFNPSSVMIQMQSHLSYPEDAGKVLKRLRGSVPVIVSSRKEDAMVVPLNEFEGKTFKNGEVSVQVHSVQADPNLPSTTIDLTIRSNEPGNDPSALGNGLNPRLMAFRTPNVAQNQIEIVDAQGRIYHQWFPASTQGDDQETRMTLRLMPAEGLGPPVQLKFYDMSRAQTEVRFEFSDVPLP